MHGICETVDTIFYLLFIYPRDNLSDCVKLVWIYDAGPKKGISVECAYLQGAFIVLKGNSSRYYISRFVE